VKRRKVDEKKTYDRWLVAIDNADNAAMGIRSVIPPWEIARQARNSSVPDIQTTQPFSLLLYTSPPRNPRNSGSTRGALRGSPFRGRDTQNHEANTLEVL
jgi:hypothetical protein